MKINSNLATFENPVFPEIQVELIGESSDMKSILPKIRNAMKASGVSEPDVDQFTQEVFSSNCYHSALNVCCRWVSCL